METWFVGSFWERVSFNQVKCAVPGDVFKKHILKITVEPFSGFIQLLMGGDEEIVTNLIGGFDSLTPFGRHDVVICHHFCCLIFFLIYSDFCVKHLKGYSINGDG